MSNKKSIKKMNGDYPNFDILYRKWRNNTLSLDEEVKICGKIGRIMHSHNSLLLLSEKHPLLVKLPHQCNSQVGKLAYVKYVKGKVVYVKGKIKQPFVTTLVVESEQIDIH